MIEPLRLTFVVDCPVDHAFSVWTRDTSRWWPADHTVTSQAALRVVFEPRTGGRVFERTAAGDEFDWGEITTWEPPHRLVYLWHLNVDRSDATEVEVTFTDQGDSTTRVKIDHRGWERLGAQAAARRDANGAGWRSLLPRYTAACLELRDGTEA